MKLLEPIGISGVAIRNRLALAAVTRGMVGEDGTASAETRRYYQNFARCGVGLIITEATYIGEEHAQTYLGQTGLSTGQHRTAWAAVVEAVKSEGASIFVQLQHGGRFREPLLGPGLGSSASVPKTLSWQQGHPYSKVKVAAASDLARVVEGFARSAALAQEAGFGGIELHGSRGYLLDEFMCGSGQDASVDLQNRMSLPLAVVAGTRQAAPRLLLGYNLSLYKMDDLSYQPAGGEVEIHAIVTALAEAGVDYVHISTRALDRCRVGDTPFLDVVRRSFGGAVIGGGGIQSLADANTVVEKGRADIVSMARSLVANPDILARRSDGREIARYSRGMERIPAE
jgi:2,4-dienoyl-CoA reductase-like NADH-dependent reductase (Old Yellow Enzyme family)